MAIVASLQISHPFPSSRNPPTSLSHKQQRQQQHRASTRALEPEKENTDTTETAPPEPTDPFENRISRVRLKYRSGTGKKAELRKAKKSGSSSKKKIGVFLPPIPLKEPVSDGMKVDFGFTAYTERLNGRLAALGLAALLLVELGSGKSLISYHKPPILFIQIYFIAAVSALFVKYEKEKVSVWPETPKSP
eukprot:TRINITY_DN5169_c0_g1_i1.p1 TRINITY_DN5169_c0_g1~~TRINITY_DN5169_c0_g1_i1.p1  ORF type:complete len:191 (-),score=21.00 TRINITY_DN5169_c0_g1_i1:100-672(-)